jgi:hypothetical protein
MRASWQPQLVAELCGTCHQDSNDPHHQGTYDGVVSEPTFMEWRDSAYGDPQSATYKTCMDCHSIALDEPRASRIGGSFTRPHGQVRSHLFEGTMSAQLESAVELDLSVEVVAGVVEVKVTLRNTGAGHHVPTGVTMRNMILMVSAHADDAPLALIEGPRVGALGGEGDPTRGDVAEVPGRLYAKVNEAEDGAGPTLFTEAVRLRSDNRIPALGQDTTTYRFRAPERDARVTVSARVIYRRAWRALVLTKGWTEDGHGRPLADITPPHFGHLMAAAQAEVLYQAPVNDGCACDQGAASRAKGVPLWLLLLLTSCLGRACRGRLHASPSSKREVR